MVKPLRSNSPKKKMKRRFIAPNQTDYICIKRGERRMRKSELDHVASLHIGIGHCSPTFHVVNLPRLDSFHVNLSDAGYSKGKTKVKMLLTNMTRTNVREEYYKV
ncbi:hypothetical protein LXL04_019190 [Taraxacum kok-saghyz]